MSKTDTLTSAEYRSLVAKKPGKKRSNAGKREDLGIYVRSSWEANYCRYLKWLKERGEILDWGYEVDEFEFPIKRGNRFYKTDFKVWNTNGSITYHEVKGYMDASSKTKLKRMAKYYPKIEIRVVDHKWFAKNNLMLQGLIPNWEKPQKRK